MSPDGAGNPGAGLILGKVVRDVGEVGEDGEDGEVYKRTHFLLTSTITAAAQAITEAQELDINPEYITSRRLGHILKKMRFIKSRQARSGKSGWMISLADVVRWSSSYGIDPESITGLLFRSSRENFTNFTNLTNFTLSSDGTWEGIL